MTSSAALGLSSFTFSVTVFISGGFPSAAFGIGGVRGISSPVVVIVLVSDGFFAGWSSALPAVPVGTGGTGGEKEGVAVSLGLFKSSVIRTGSHFLLDFIVD